MPVDFVGNPITPGCNICYPVRRGSNMDLKRITVTQATTEEINGYNSLGRRITVKNFKNVAVINVPKAA
jgi:hypothetical protein